MSDRVFVDTNLFVYADDRSAKVKRVRARAVLSELIRTRRAIVSTQVMQEYFAAATRKLGLSPGAIDLCRLHGLSFWDVTHVL